jgi:hypothetical protein
MSVEILNKFIATSFLTLAICGPAYAGNGWVLAADNVNGGRYLVSVPDFDYAINENGVHVFSMPVRFVEYGDMVDGYVALDAEGCGDSGGQMVFGFSDGDKHKFWWSPDGNRVYDHIGATVCMVGKEVLIAAKNKKGNSKPAEFVEMKGGI